MKRRDFLSNTSLFLSAFSLSKFVEFDSTPLLTKTLADFPVNLILFQKNNIIAASLIRHLSKKYKNSNFFFTSSDSNSKYANYKFFQKIDRNKHNIIFYEKESNLDDTLFNSSNLYRYCDNVLSLNTKVLTVVKARAGISGEFVNLYCSGSLIRTGRDSYYYTNIEER